MPLWLDEGLAHFFEEPFCQGERYQRALRKLYRQMTQGKYSLRGLLAAEYFPNDVFMLIAQADHLVSYLRSILGEEGFNAFLSEYLTAEEQTSAEFIRAFSKALGQPRELPQIEAELLKYRIP